VMRIVNEGRDRHIAVFGGIAEILNDTLTIVTSGAEWPNDINRVRVETDIEHAEQRLQEKKDDLEILSDQLLLRRSLVLLEASSYTVKEEV